MDNKLISVLDEELAKIKEALKAIGYTTSGIKLGSISNWIKGHELIPCISLEIIPELPFEKN